MKRKIYLASSWKNAQKVRELAKILREFGHDVFDFTDPSNKIGSLEKFVFSATQWAKENGKPANEIEWKDFLLWNPTQKAFISDKAGLDWSNTVILLNPSGRSSHLEAGYGAGQGKELFIFGDLPLGEFDAMYGFAGPENCYRNKELLDLINRLEAPRDSSIETKLTEASK
jgi:hypothetical protein